MTVDVDAQGWIFDLDGTLTVAVHDFDALRERLGLRSAVPILETIAVAPPVEAERLSRLVEEWEWELAECAVAAPGAEELLSKLKQQSSMLGIVTRNTRPIALRTLEVTGLLRFFDPTYILGRENAEPKPSPAGIQWLLEAWKLEPKKAVMLGDYLFDVQAGRTAGTATVLVGADEPEWAQWVDSRVTALSQIRPQQS
jgi:HAD superfamily hydrolase (TIGR01509 family)